jgi:type IV secretory pathway VirB4 component
MIKVEYITKDWKEAGSFPAQINLYGFWDEHSFLTKSGDLGSVLRIGGIDYESLDHAGRDYAVKRTITQPSRTPRMRIRWSAPL